MPRVRQTPSVLLQPRHGYRGPRSPDRAASLEEQRLRRRAEDTFVLQILNHVKTIWSQLRLPKPGEIRFAVRHPGKGRGQIRSPVRRARNARSGHIEPLAKSGRRKDYGKGNGAHWVNHRPARLRKPAGFSGRSSTYLCSRLSGTQSAWQSHVLRSLLLLNAQRAHGRESSATAAET